MKNKIMILLFTIIFLGSCAPKRVIEEKEKIVYVDKVKTDSIFIEKIINTTDTISNEVIIDCDSTSLSQKFNDGKSNIQIIKEDGKVKIKYVKLPSETKTEYVYVEKKESNDSIVSEKENKQVDNTTHTTFWDKLGLKFYQTAFYIILVLWIFGITPLKIFSIIKKLVV